MGVVTVAAKLLFAAWAASVCLHFRGSACSVALLMLGVYWLCTRCLNISLPSIQLLFCPGDISLLFKLILNIPRAEAPLLVVKISKKTGVFNAGGNPAVD